jgi:transforming growth factor-beta-induced protein
MRDIATTLASRPDLTRFVQLIADCELTATLQQKGPLTVFAPVDGAFDALPADRLQQLIDPQNKAANARVANFHIVPAEWSVSRMKGTMWLESTCGQRLRCSVHDARLEVGLSRATVTDIRCSNGVIHVIDAVQMPVFASVTEVLRADGRFTMFLDALGQTDFKPKLDGAATLTLFAPTDAALTSLPKGEWSQLMLPRNRERLQGFVKRHATVGRVYSEKLAKGGVLSFFSGELLTVAPQGSTITISGAKLTRQDIEASNGVVHVVDRAFQATPNGGAATGKP